MVCVGLPINVLESDISLTEMLVAEGDESGWEDVEFEVALDSGSIVNVCHPDDAPGYVLQESLGSKMGQNVIVGNGGKLGNLGEKHLNLDAPSGTGDAIHSVASIFQIANVTRPLMSVGHICDQGLNVIFDKQFAIVRNAGGEEVCRFTRNDGGLDVCNMKLTSPFDGQRK